MYEPREEMSDAHDMARRMVSHIEQALAAIDPDEMQEQIREAMEVGEQLEVVLGDFAFDSEDHAQTDAAERALGYLRAFFKLGVQTLSGDESEFRERSAKMRPLAIEAAAQVTTLVLK